MLFLNTICLFILFISISFHTKFPLIIIFIFSKNIFRNIYIFFFVDENIFFIILFRYLITILLITILLTILINSILVLNLIYNIEKKGILRVRVEICNNFPHLLSSFFVLSSTNLYFDNAL